MVHKHEIKGFPISGPMRQTEGLQVAEKSGITKFEASDGWLKSFGKKHSIVWNEISGKAVDVNVQTVEEWKLETLEVSSNLTIPL